MSPRTVPPPPTEPGADDSAAAEARVWYYQQRGERTGPVSLGYLQHHAAAGRLTPKTLVWRQGMPAWTRLASVMESDATTTLGGAPTGTPVPSGDLLLWLAACAPVLPLVTSRFGLIGVAVGWGLAVPLQVVLAMLDDRRLDLPAEVRAELGPAWLVPAWMLRRAALEARPPVIAVFWLVATGVAILAGIA